MSANPRSFVVSFFGWYLYWWYPFFWLWAFLVHKMIPRREDDRWVVKLCTSKGTRWSMAVVKTHLVGIPLPPVHGCEVWHQLGSCSRVGYLAGTTKIRVYNCIFGTLRQMYLYVKITYACTLTLLGSWYLSHNICDTKSRNIFSQTIIARIKMYQHVNLPPHFMILLFGGMFLYPSENLVGKPHFRLGWWDGVLWVLGFCKARKKKLQRHYIHHWFCRVTSTFTSPKFATDTGWSRFATFSFRPESFWGLEGR